MKAEYIIKASQCSVMLVDDIREAHKHACYKTPFLEMLLRDLLTQAVTIKQRLNEIEIAAKEGSKA